MKQILNYFKQIGVRFDETSRSLKLNPNLFPKLAYSRQSNSFVVFYPSPNNNEFGQQSFYFDELKFLNAFNDAKFKKYKSKDSYKTFEELFFNPNANFCIKLIFKYFDVTPTNLNYALRQRKRKLTLKPKQKKILHDFFGVNNYVTNDNPRNSKKSSSRQFDVVQILCDNFLDYYALVNILKSSVIGFNLTKNFELTIQKLKHFTESAAKFYDMNLFSDFLMYFANAVKQIDSSLNTRFSKKQIQKIYEKFASAVDKIQKSMI